MMKRPRIKNEKHLNFIRAIPCILCDDNTTVEAAHVKLADRRADKRECGKGEKPDDAFALPVCGRHHRLQHTMSERAFWEEAGIEPIFVCLALYRVSGDHEAGCRIVAENRP